MFILVILVLGIGGYFYLSQNTVKQFTPQGQRSATQPSSVTNLTPTPITEPEDDLTALDKDLADLDSSDTNFTEDFNGL